MSAVFICAKAAVAQKAKIVNIIDAIISIRSLASFITAPGEKDLVSCWR
jgi:hypothetical protein